MSRAYSENPQALIAKVPHSDKVLAFGETLKNVVTGAGDAVVEAAKAIKNDGLGLGTVTSALRPLATMDTAKVVGAAAIAAYAGSYMSKGDANPQLDVVNGPSVAQTARRRRRLALLGESHDAPYLLD